MYMTNTFGQIERKNLDPDRLSLVTNQSEITQQLSEECQRLWLANLHKKFDGKTMSNI